ncbi:MAG: SGNH/GDSL hydrolase family protein [Gemmatimonadetes bacterium]|jgi:acyl-CoA thioesterase I|nr:SGNH/GDSL hydrolase family protein [Gemmatimonadota bacterium]MBT6149521.1 SGNH/GDSL hydrolase family protein [Gemmatimonadota bacterium]MBT7860495.1 SGNH/GDSL hydrolase family protein [Gemmatimonadota bacterium]
MSDWFENDTTFLFIGDSITDCGRRGAEAPLGAGYVRSVTELVTGRYPDRQIRWINKGIGGHKVSDLRERWRDDVLYHKPDRLSIKIGINDLHTHLRASPEGVSPERFAELYDEILGITRDELGQLPIVLLTPFYISTERGSDTMRGRVQELLPSYIDTVVSMSQKYDTRLVQLHDVFQRHLQYRDADTFCPEPVHPNHTGHTIIAQAVVDELS